MIFFETLLALLSTLVFGFDFFLASISLGSTFFLALALDTDVLELISVSKLLFLSFLASLELSFFDFTNLTLYNFLPNVLKKVLWSIGIVVSLVISLSKRRSKLLPDKSSIITLHEIV